MQVVTKYKFELSGLILGDDGQIALRKVAALIAVIVWSTLQIARTAGAILSMNHWFISPDQMQTFDKFAQSAISDALYMLGVAGGWSVLNRATTKDVTTPYPSQDTDEPAPKETS